MSTSQIKSFINYFKKYYLKTNIRSNEFNLDKKIAHSARLLAKEFTEKNNRYQFISSHFMDAVNEGCLSSLNELERKKRVIDEINTSIYGALGEQKVVKELENLSDDYVLINDFAFTFPTPIYFKQEDAYIKSIQIDHVLISPAGIFLIETKNWSEQSLNNSSLRSPVQQIRRSNFAFFMLLNGEAISSNLNINQHHWGERKIPIRNLIVLTNVKPIEEFQYVKVLTLNELVRYVKYFKYTFSSAEAGEIANYLLNLLKKK